MNSLHDSKLSDISTPQRIWAVDRLRPIVDISMHQRDS